jgi:site-specific recombinase XerD
MTNPAKLRLRDRIGKDAAGVHYFVCQKRGHKRLMLRFTHKRDAETARAQHDTFFHTVAGRVLASQGIGRVHALGPLVDTFLDEKSRKHPATLSHYRNHTNFLLRHFGPARIVEEIDQEAVDRFVAWRLKHTATGGAAAIKDLVTLGTMLRSKGIPVHWRIKHGDIAAKRRERIPMERARIKAFLGALAGGSPERAFVLLKLRTAIRDVEAFDLRCGDVDSHGFIRFPLRSKRRSGRVHVFPIGADVIAALAPLMAGKGPDDYVFSLRRNKLTKASLRVRFRRASERAGIEPPICGVGQIRHEMITLAKQKLGLKAVSEAIGHRSQATTWLYLLDDGDMETKRKMEQALADAISG